MSAFIATALVDISRGTGQDEWGDDTGVGDSVASGVPASVSEDRQRSFLGSEDRGGVVEFHTVRFRPGVDVREGDRITTGGVSYIVESVDSSPSVVGLSDLRCVTRRTATSSAS